MTEYLKKIMEEIGFSDDACKYFMNMYSQLGGDCVCNILLTMLAVNVSSNISKKKKQIANATTL